MADLTSQRTPFDLLGPLPEGTTVLEASAGTGKTYTIAALVARYLAEGEATMDQLLVVSFSRESTRELRERVRERLVSARDGLQRPSRPGDDLLLEQLRAVDEAEIELRRGRLEDALALFDAATVTTTHGFCQQVLLALGTAGDHDPDAVLVEDIGDLVAEVADDLYLRKWGVEGAEQPQLSRSDFVALAKAVTYDPATALLPDPATPGLPGLRATIAKVVREEVVRRKRLQRTVDYDDMLLRLDSTLNDPTSGPVARARLRERYTVVLVDEFQDTDPVQWSILREAFHGQSTLVLIGDPKQSIYGFRGADVHAYLNAAKEAVTISTLPTNWRSDALLLAGTSAVFRGAALGDERIKVVPVGSVHEGRMVPGAPVRLRTVLRAGNRLVKGDVVSAPLARRIVAGDLAAEVVELLSAGTPVTPRDGSPQRSLAPGDIAVLVRANSQAQEVRGALEAVDVPVVVSARTSVFATPAAEEWELLLEAMEQPHRVTRVRRLALSCFVGDTATSLAQSADADELGLDLRLRGEVLEQRGVAALFEAVSLSRGLQSRVLSRPDGERLLTDLRHIAQALHEAALEGQLGLTALLAWLRRRRLEAAGEGGQERSRRLETDAAAVQVITVHTSKGLEFPVVMVPFAWNHYDFTAQNDPATVVYHDGDVRVRDVGGRGSPDWRAHLAKHRQEEIDDELRLTYVAITRAQSQLYLWWAPTTNTPQSPLHRLLMHDGTETVPAQSLPVPDDARAQAVFKERAAASEGGLEVEVVDPRRRSERWSPAASATLQMRLAKFGRSVDTTWRRTSYSALTAAAHDPGRLGSEPELAQKDDEADLPEPGADGSTSDQALSAVPSAWSELAGGTAFGTMVHAILERLEDPADHDAVQEAVRSQTARFGARADADVLSAGLLAALATPLGAVADGRALQDFDAADRLPELDFELPLAGGDEPVERTPLLAELAPLWRAHCPSGPLSSYADQLDTLAPATLRGYLTGSIDAVLRVGGTTTPRYLVVDYKTNRLGAFDEDLTAWHYRPQALERAMIEAHYPLQALLYDVALHRYLRWRQPGYDPQVHLGGALYLFLRGMSGPGVLCADGSAPGVFGWRPPAGLVTGLSDLLAGAGVPR